MDNRKNNKIDAWDDGVYGTGKTEPPKNNSGIIALLMIIIIFLSGIISGLSFMNIRLFHQLQQAQVQQDSIPMAFSQVELEPEEHILQDSYGASESVIITPLGLTGEYVSKFDQHYFSWPPGFLITDVAPDSPAEVLGLEIGDILTAINSAPITSQSELDSFLASGNPEAVSITVHRDGQEVTLNGK